MHRAFLVVWGLSACGVDEGDGDLPGQAPPPSFFIDVGDIVPGGAVVVQVRGAVPGQPVAVGATTQGTRPGATCPPALGGACLDLVNPTLLGRARANGSGEATIRLTAPATLPVGALAYVQAASIAGPASATSYVSYVTVLDPACPQILADFAAESQAIRSCTTAGQCGTVLSGTSCGCTRDWVARTGVSTSRFYQLLADASACGLELISTCDCPQTYGFDCVSNTCTWDYVP